MKYNLSINQVKSIEWELTTSEAILFSWIYELPSWADKIEYQSKTYYFASRHLACKEIPIVSDKADTIYRIYKKLQEKNLIETISFQKKDYVCLTKKGQEWYNDNYSEKNPELGKKSEMNSEKNPTNNNTSIYHKNELSFNNLIKENKDNSKKSEDDELFEQLWSAYNRKGSKQNAKKQWAKIPQEDKGNILPHLKVYVDCNETKYTKDFERYLKDKVYKNVVYDKNNNVVYDPEYSTKYTPTGNNLIQWSEKYNVYVCSDDFDYYNRNRIRDGYTDQDRPDGATIVLYGGRGTIQWCKENNKWEYVQK